MPGVPLPASSCFIQFKYADSNLNVLERVCQNHPLKDYVYLILNVGVLMFEHLRVQILADRGWLPGCL